MSRTFQLTAPIPLEWQEQAALFQFAALTARNDPRWKWLNASQSGLPTTLQHARRAKACGMKAGIPDLHLPIPNRRYHGLYIELKRRNATACHLRPEQREWLEQLNAWGYCALVAHGWEHAVTLIHAYLEEAPMSDLLPMYHHNPETLMHYHHPGCSGSSDPWWTISDGVTDRDLYCPHCGQRLSPAQYETSPRPSIALTHEVDL